MKLAAIFLVLLVGVHCDVIDDDFKTAVMKEITTLKEKVATLEEKLRSAEVENHALRRRSEAKRSRELRQTTETMFPENEVAFSARVSNHVKNMTAHQPIVFGTTLTNIGGSYNNSTGMFFAPVHGTYVFYVNILSESNNSIETELVVNGNLLAEIYSGAGRFHGAGSNYVVVRLQHGDNVWVKVHAAYSTDMAVHCCWSTFSGYLLRQMYDDGPSVIG